MKKITEFTGKISSITYNGLSSTVNDGTKSVTTTKNALGNVISTTDPGGTINNTYFANGNLKSADFNGSTEAIEQDGWGRKTRLTDPSAGVYSYTYDEFGDVLTETTPKGSTSYVYDTKGKLQSKHITGDNGTDMSYAYTYDGTTKLLTATSLTNADGNSTNYTYTYDSYKRPSSTVEDNTYAKFTKTLTYNTYGHVATESSEAQNKTNHNITVSKTISNAYQYGQLKSISDNANGHVIWTVNGLDARGNITSALFGSVLKETNTFDQYGLPQEIKTEQASGATPAQLLKLNYTFDAQRGNLSSRSTTNAAFTMNESFTYDSQDRLTGYPAINGNQTQSYDSQGRIQTNSRLGTYTYTGNSYQQTGMVGLTDFAKYHYNQLQLQQITFNAFKQPVEIVEHGKEKASFQYNGDLQRSHMFYGDTSVEKLSRPMRRHYSEDGSMEITEDIPNGKTSFVFYLGGDAYGAPAIWKDERTSSTTTAGLYYLHRDYQGSIMMITDASGSIKEQRQFDAWGNIVKLTDSVGTTLTTFAILDRGYTGHEHLLGVGLINMNARLYDPLLHRFLSPDDYIQDPTNTQNFNRYTYGLNNPLKYTDKDGKFFEILAGAAISVITNGISNVINHKSFFDGAGRAALMGAFGGAFSMGIGNVVNEMGLMEMSTFQQVAFQTTAHTITGGAMNVMGGGSFGSGALSSGIASLASYGTGLLLQNTDRPIQVTGMLVSGTLSGGLTSAAAGGGFWEGARNGLITAALNHVAHLIQHYHEFYGEMKAEGHMFNTDIESNEFSGVSTTTFQDAKYLLLARYYVKQLSAQKWTVKTAVYYIGPNVDNMHVDASMSVSGRPDLSQLINADNEGSVLVPNGWTYQGSAGYDFTNNAGNFNVGVHVSVRTYTFAGNQPGTGYLNFIIPIRKN